MVRPGRRRTSAGILTHIIDRPGTIEQADRRVLAIWNDHRAARRSLKALRKLCRLARPTCMAVGLATMGVALDRTANRYEAGRGLEREAAIECKLTTNSTNLTNGRASSWQRDELVVIVGRDKQSLTEASILFVRFV